MGSACFTTVGHDAFVLALKERISYFKLGEGGFILSGLITEIIDSSATGGNDTYDYTIGGGEFDVIGVNQGLKKFVIDGLYASWFPVDTRIKVEGSTGNDGFYTVVSATEVAGDTEIVVDEAIPDSTVDGIVYVDHLPVAIGPTSDAKHFPLVVQELTPGDVLVQEIEDTTGTGGLSGDGTGTINYKNGALHVVFASNVTAGNKVVVTFKTHDRKKDSSVGTSYTKLESEDSPVAPDGNRELYTFDKNFGADVNTIVLFKGAGTGTIRAKVYVENYEGIDDGRGTTYGGIPYYFEGGVFDDQDVLLAYFTFEKERKTGSVRISHTVDFIA